MTCTNQFFTFVYTICNVTSVLPNKIQSILYLSHLTVLGVLQTGDPDVTLVIILVTLVVLEAAELGVSRFRKM